MAKTLLISSMKSTICFLKNWKKNCLNRKAEAEKITDNLKIIFTVFVTMATESSIFETKKQFSFVIVTHLHQISFRMFRPDILAKNGYGKKILQY